jgi:aspartyl-tRNA(Asn)/glutamyl-tRNA(Gln) amidotransferase subunit B
MTTATHRGATGVLERWEPVIGIEVHCQLRTASKMFCRCATTSDGAPPNSLTCPVCLGLPGALPVANRHAVDLVLATGLAIEATNPETTRWERKNYFYPDLPKGYQISQYAIPLTMNGRLTIDTDDGPFTVGITRAHLEEDTARLVHSTAPDGGQVSLIDFNRSGVPLMEIVTEPDIRTPEQARRYAEELQLLLRTIGASDAEMEKGQLRVEANVSIRPRGSEPFGTRVEVKNMNSFRSVERAIAHEIERQAAAIERGEAVVQETRGWDEDRGRTFHQRTKEDSEDYRYFPEPDLPPLRIEPAWLAELAAALPELPAARRARYAATLGLSSYDAAVIVNDRAATSVFDALTGAGIEARLAATWVTGEYLRLKKRYPDRDAGFVADPSGLAELIDLVRGGAITTANAKEVFETHFAAGTRVAEIVERAGYRTIGDAEALAPIVEDVLAANPTAVADYRSGKDQAIGFLVGQVMKATRGQADATVAATAIRERLGEISAD